MSKLSESYKFDTDKCILHIGAHECEERDAYLEQGFTDSKIIWVEGNKNIVSAMKSRNSNLIIHQGLVGDIDDKEVDFIITNNGQSSSILELEEHKTEHPWVYEVGRSKQSTITVDTLLKNIDVKPENIDFINIDIQGAELLAFKGMTNLLKCVHYIYTEVNIKHLYKDCALMSEIDDFLQEYNFFRRETVMTQNGWGDALYVRV